MLRHQLIHPQILEALGSAGHGSQVLVADGNYPFTTGSNAAAARVYLNLSPGVVGAVEVVAALASAIPIEDAACMTPGQGAEPDIHDEFRAQLPGVSLRRLDRLAFYDAARGPDVALVVATGERRVYANVLLTVGVRAPAE